MRRPRSALVAALAIGLALGSFSPTWATAAAEVCDITQVETLTIHLPARPATVPVGRAISLPVRVTRGDQAAADVNVAVALVTPLVDAFTRGVTAADGSVRLSLTLPKGARGVTELDVEAYRTVIELPCLTIEEYDRTTTPWAKVR
ncbi:MAG TPA: hypothetical protein VNA30_01045 [Mycobacteriales bacterium]|nr:hypothetical protein [Mycobacteriales bacterium]